MRPAPPAWTVLVMLRALLLPLRSAAALAPAASTRMRAPTPLRSASLFRRSTLSSNSRLPRLTLPSLVVRYAGGAVAADTTEARLAANGESGSSGGGALGSAESARRLAAVRMHMHALGLDALIVPSDDPHLSE